MKNEDKTKKHTGELQEACQCAAGQNISENDHTQPAEMLLESEGLFRSIAEFSLDSIHVTDINGNIIYWNKASVQLFGYEEREVLGKSNEILVPGWVKETETAKKERFLKTEIFNTKAMPFESVALKKDGLEFPVEITLSIWGLNEKKFFTCIVRDITKRKMTEVHLRQSQKIESVGTLAGGVAHEFNNILGGIMGYTEIAIDDVPKESPVRESLVEILKLSSQAKDVVKQILSFSRKGKIELKPLQPHLVIKDSLKLFRATIPATIKIKHNIDENSGIILGDLTQLNQISTNLCINAAHAMEVNGGVLEIGLVPVVLETEDVKSFMDLKPGEYVKLTVSDTGTGIDSKIINKIFDPFFTTKEVGKGSGMGLSVIHGIIKDHGGAIGVSSTPGKGTIFEVFLPKIETKIVKTKSPDAIPTGTENVLVVDDEEQMVFLMRKILERLGYRVTALSSSLETLELFKKDPQRYDLIITDLTMPHLTGDRLASEVLAIRPDMSVIIASGYTDAIDSDKIQQSGIKAFIPKPIQKQELAKTIRLILDEN